MRRCVFAGNWKMNKTASEAAAVAREVRAGLDRQPTPNEVVVFPPFTALPAVAEALRGSAVALGAQNMHWEREGAFTGEVSPVMLRDVGCTFVILGHSERRHIFGETDEGVGRKARAAVDQGLTPIVCVGETLAERESSRTLEVVERQVERALRPLAPAEVARMVVSYEPVWAIGTGKTATPEQAREAHAEIKSLLDVPVLYGGSANPGNTPGLMAQGDIDGLLVGGASLKADSFLAMVGYRAG